jgi:hypothetical protein
MLYQLSYGAEAPRGFEPPTLSLRRNSPLRHRPRGSLGNGRYGFQPSDTQSLAARSPRRAGPAGPAPRYDRTAAGFEPALTRCEVSVSSPPTKGLAGDKRPPIGWGFRGNSRNGGGRKAFVDNRSTAALHHPELITRNARVFSHRQNNQVAALSGNGAPPSRLLSPPRHRLPAQCLSFPPSGPRACRAFARGIRVSPPAGGRKTWAQTRRGQ